MIINEEKSDYMICPRMVYGSMDPGSDNGCRGSQCAAWRWARERNPDWKPVSSLNMALAGPFHPDDLPKEYIASKTHGYCGLAGTP